MTGHALRPSNGRATVLLDAWLAGEVLLLAFLLCGPALTIPLHVPLNHDEGWNAAFDTRAVMPNAGPLYPPPGALVFNNYPPGGFLLVGAIGRLAFNGDMILAGRVVALVALLAVASFVGMSARALGASRRAAVAAGLLLLLVAATRYRGYVAMADPQWLAEAFATGGFALLLGAGAGAHERDRSFPAGAVAGAAVLVVAGILIKHNALALAFALTLWLCGRDRRAAFVWIIAGSVAISVAAIAAALRYGSPMFDGIFRHERLFRPGAFRLAGDALWPLAPAAAIALLSRRRSVRTGSSTLPLLFLALALASGVAQRAGAGVNYNAQFETAVAVALAFGVALGDLSRSSPGMVPRPHATALLTVVAAVLPVLVLLPATLPRAWHDIVDRSARQRAWHPMIARLATAPGPVGCEMQSLCTWAGRPFTIDVFNLTERAIVEQQRNRGRDGAVPPARSPLDTFDRAVAAGQFSMLEAEPHAATHAEARRAIGHDPVLDRFRGAPIVLRGPDGAVLLAFAPPAGTQAPNRGPGLRRLPDGTRAVPDRTAAFER